MNDKSLEEKDIANIVSGAIGARKFSYAPYSQFAVGAALLCRSGKLYAAANVENISLGLTICAERAAACAAISAGDREFVAIGIAGGLSEPVVMCGACRQFLAEFAPDLTIISVAESGQRRIDRLSKLFPEPRRGIMQ